MTAAKQALIGLSKGSEARFIDAWIEGDLELPVCPCKSTDLYAKYLSWCKRNGEFKPRPSSQFFGWIGNMPGWDKRKARHYRDLSSTEAQNSPIVTPPLEILQASGFAPPAGESSRTRWLTECVVRFANDAQFEGGGAGAGP
jgi:phage/plasmid-associated DNA primase